MYKEKKLMMEEIADLYDKHHGGRPARTMAMVDIYQWAVKNPQLIKVHNDSTLSLREPAS